MKDEQPRKRSPDPRIPLISPLLHIISMSMIVVFRRGFGLAYLRPLSVFVTIAWVLALFSICAWHYEDLWRAVGALCCFGLTAMGFYVFHLTASCCFEQRKGGKHDLASGDSWLVDWVPGKSPEKVSAVVQLWIEPGITVLVGLGLAGFTRNDLLGCWLILAGMALFLKECINQWHRVRIKKRNYDAMKDAKTMMAGAVEEVMPQRNFGNGRVSVKRDTVREAPKADAQQFQVKYAQLLGMEPPYSVGKAEKMYTLRVAELRPDGTEANNGLGACLSKLQLALDYFRKHPKLE